MTNNGYSTLIDKELIQRTLQSYHNITTKSTFKIKAYDFKLLSENGENFSSEIYQVDIQYELDGNNEKKSFIAKILLPETIELGSNEYLMLNKILPEMEKCLKMIENGSKLHARCLISERNEKEEFYILENLNSLGYFCADRTKGVDLKHAEVLMKKIAKFHAVSMLCAKKYPELINSLRKSGFEKGASDDISKAITYGGFEYVANMIKEWPSYEKLSQKVLNLIPNYNDRAKEVVNSKSSRFNVINHSDLWVNNFLFKYDDKTPSSPIDMLLIDFENSFWGSCGFDINWFLNSSLELKVLKENRLHLVQIYYKALRKILEKGYYPQEELPSLEDVQTEVRRCEFIGLYISLCEFPMFALERNKSQNLDNDTFCQPDKAKILRELLYGNPRVKDTLAYSLKYFEEINVL